MSDRLQQLFAAIDEVNAHDPVKVALPDGFVSRSTLYGRRMSGVLQRFRPEANELLHIAARAQHIERWIIPRSSYPEGREAYLVWRKALQRHHAQRTGELMRSHGYSEADISRVGDLLQKRRLKYDPDVQALEDVICLVFLEYEAADFIAKHPDEKVRDILAKTSVKMSPEGLAAAGRLPLDERLGRLLTEVLAA